MLHFAVSQKVIVTITFMTPLTDSGGLLHHWFSRDLHTEIPLVYVNYLFKAHQSLKNMDWFSSWVKISLRCMIQRKD